MIFIDLPKGYKALVDDDDADLACLKWWITSIKWGPYAMREEPMVRGKRGKKMALHRVIARRMGYDISDKQFQVDHINGNPLDNRRANIRFVTPSENTRNQGLSCKNTSGFKGVSYDRSRDKWMAFVKVEGRFKNLGRFDTMEEANAARLVYEKELWGIQPRRAHLFK